MVTSTIDKFILIASTITSGFTYLFDVLFTDVWSFITTNGNANPFLQWLLESDLIAFTGLSDWLSTITLGGFLFSVIALVIAVVYFFIP